ncbi:hypothetical protein F4677DRAFT_35959 [Hypoxylon crocopeplum]|nr:hypothetical protein F4677DRAFT_35959 [Hypoxylon crocopeplum]
MGHFRGSPGCSQTVRILLESGCSASSAASFNKVSINAKPFEVTAFDCLWLWIVGLSVPISLIGISPAYDSSSPHVSEIWSTLETFRAHGARPTWFLIWLVDKDHLDDYPKSTDLRIHSSVSAKKEVRPQPDDRLQLSTHVQQIFKAHLQKRLQKELQTRGNVEGFDGVVTIEFEDVVRYFHPPNMEQILHPTKRKGTTASVNAVSTVKSISDGDSSPNYIAPYSRIRVPMTISIVVLILAILGALSHWML